MFYKTVQFIQNSVQFLQRTIQFIQKSVQFLQRTVHFIQKSVQVLQIRRINLSYVNIKKDDPINRPSISIIIGSRSRWFYSWLIYLLVY